MNTQDCYLRVVYLIQVATNEPAGTGAIADRLDLSPASANEMVGELEADGLADHEKYKGVTLTDAGIERTRETVETYCIIERFLFSVLDLEAYRGKARQLEGVIDVTVAE
jgi:Mn-dependent DtxR family transcriptional regulator